MRAEPLVLSLSSALLLVFLLSSGGIQLPQLGFPRVAAAASAGSGAAVHDDDDDNDSSSGTPITTKASFSNVLDFLEDFGAVPWDDSDEVCERNSWLLEGALKNNASNHTLHFPRNVTFYFHPGIVASHVNDTVIAIDGTLKFQRPRKKKKGNKNLSRKNDYSSVTHGGSGGSSVGDGDGGGEEYYYNDGDGGRDARNVREHWYDPPPALFIVRSRNVTITSSASLPSPLPSGGGGGSNGSSSSENSTTADPSPDVDRNHRGVIDGQGSQYWGVPFVGYLEIAENRPRLLRFNLTEDLLIENVVLKDPAYHALYLTAVNRVEVRNVSIVARRTRRDGHSLLDLSAFNTDGIDVCGHNVHVHDVDIWNQDDCITVTDNYFHDHVSSNMTFENINASGLGFAIGSIGGSTVRNITFRNSYVHRSVKGLYLKFHDPEDYWVERNLTGLIEDIKFENIVIEQPTQWPIWIGPAQQADARNPCKANPCSLCWPLTPTSQCNVVPTSKYRNITLSDVRINKPRYSPGVLLSTDENPMENVRFYNVRVTKGKPSPYANNLLETFPGLKEPVHDKYVPSGESDDERFAEWQAGGESSGFDVFEGAADVLPYDDDANSEDEDEEEEILERKKFSALAIVLIVGSSILGALLIVSLVHFAWQWKKTHDARRQRQQRNSERQQQRQEGEGQEEGQEDQRQSASRRVVRFQDLVEVKSDDGTAASENNTMQVPLLEPRHSSASLSSADDEEIRFSTSFHINLYHWLGVLILSVAISVTYIVIRWPFGPDWYRADKYYKCEGVQNGIASGNTWPVPDCFKEERKTWWHNLAISIPVIYVYVVLGLFLLAGFAYAIHVFRRQDRADTSLLLSSESELRHEGVGGERPFEEPQRSASFG